MSVCTPKSFDLTGKVALITGASYGIGFAIATAMANCGATIVFNDIKQELVDKGLAAYKEAGINAHGYVCDVTNEDAVNEMVKKITAEVGHINVLVNNAGILPKFKRFDRYSDEEIERAININFYSCVYSVKTFLPMLLQSTDPGIVNIDSSAALMSLAGTSMYSASKAALKGFTEALREEFRGKCYVGLVCPGFTKTDIFRGQSNAGGKGEKVINMISTDCDLMVKMIMFGIEHKQALQIHGVDAHAMSVFGKLLPVNGSRLFSAVMKAADIDLFKEVFKDDAELAE